jgi:hypothetical protein
MDEAQRKVLNLNHWHNIHLQLDAIVRALFLLDSNDAHRLASVMEWWRLVIQIM